MFCFNEDVGGVTPADKETLVKTTKRGFIAIILFCIVIVCITNFDEASTLSNALHGGNFSYQRILERHRSPNLNSTKFVPPLRKFVSSLLKQPTTRLRDVQTHSWDNSRIKNTSICILSAVGLNGSDYMGYRSQIKLTGWISNLTKQTTYKCCTILRNGTVAIYDQPDMNGAGTLKYAGKQFTCHVNVPLTDVMGVALQVGNNTCPLNQKRYLKPYIPKPPTVNDSFAVCLKLVYGQKVDNVNLKTWLEYYITLGVDKIFMYTYDISKTTNAVLNIYRNKGYLETRPFDYPFKKSFKIGEKVGKYYETEHVLIYDCFQRATRYKYFAIVDMDEFIVPRIHNNFKSMMEYLLKLYPTASGFNILTYLFLKRKTIKSANMSDIETYFERTEVMQGSRSRLKNILLRERVIIRGLNTHEFLPQEGYSRKIVTDPDVVSTNHYRNCYRDKKRFCSQPLTKDTFILKFVDRFRDKLIV